MAIKANLEATISELGDAGCRRARLLPQVHKPCMPSWTDELILDFISQWLEAKHKQQKAWALEQGVPETFEAFLQSNCVLPAIFWDVVAKACSEPRQQVDAADVTRSASKDVPVSIATAEGSFRNLVSAYNRLRPNNKTSAAETGDAARLFRSKEHIDKFKLQPLRTKRFATLFDLIRICSVAFTLLLSVKDGGRGQFKSAQDRLQLCAILCVIFYSGCRPGDAMRARGYLDNIYALLWQDFTFFYRVIEGVTRLCVHVVLRNQKGRKNSPRGRRAFIAYSHPKLPAVVDLPMLLASLALKSKVLVGIKSARDLEATIFHALIGASSNSLPLKIVGSKKLAPVFQQIRLSGRRKPWLANGKSLSTANLSNMLEKVKGCKRTDLLA